MRLGSAGGGAYFVTTAVAVKGPQIQLGPRPNNINAYAAGNVFGPAADARLIVPVPALPTGVQLVTPGYNTLNLYVEETRAPTDGASCQFAYYLKHSPFVTVLGDQAGFSLTDAEIADLLPNGSAFGALTGAFATGLNNGNVLNTGAGITGRRGAIFSLTFPGGEYMIPGAQLGLYLVAQAAYTPLALESILIVPSFVGLRIIVH